MRAFMHGRYEETQRLAAEAWSHGESAHPENAFQVNQVLTLFLLREAGQLDLLVEGLEEYVAQSPLSAWRSALALVYAELGRPDDALAQVATFSEERFTAIPRDAVWFATVGMLTQALAEDRRARLLPRPLRAPAPVRGAECCHRRRGALPRSGLAPARRPRRRGGGV